ncbi:MAG TPA: hypothetical protein VF266_24675 [Thermoanaerobaculia bacterium]
MRKLVIATTLTLVLAGTASAAKAGSADRGPRERDTPIVRVIKLIKRVFTPSANAAPTVPIP